jgi:transposase InsO family protein
MHWQQEEPPMPWKETCTMRERELFIDAWLEHDCTVARLCERFGISSKTGYKWINRFKAEGLPGLSDRSRARHTQSHRTPEAVVEQILRLKHSHPDWGPVTIGSALYRDQPDRDWPVDSTIGEILKRHGLVKPRRKRHKVPPQSQPLAHATAPNEVWSADYKGQFRLGDGSLCYPLTISDNHSRLLLCCQGLPGPRLVPSMKTYKQVFREYGLPRRIRTDNGFPFAMVTLGGLTPLTVWLVKLGIIPERIEAGCPQQNGRHERMHRTLKAATASPPRGSLSAQQRAFNRFRKEFNEERPHQSLGRGVCPADIHQPSPRAYPEKLSEIYYADGLEVRKVKGGGYIMFNGHPYYVTRQLVGEHVGLEAIGHGRWQLYFSMLRLAVLDERLQRVIRPV